MQFIPLNGPAFDNFINSLNVDKTKNEYKRNLVEFATWRKVKTFDQLLQGDPIELKNHITKYLTYLRKEKSLSSGTINIATSSLRHFYTQNDKVLNWDIIRKFIIREDIKKNTDKEYTYEDISKVISLADLKYKMAIYLMVSSGVRIGALHTMKVGDLEKMKGHDIYKVTVYRGSRDEYFTFCSPECFAAVNNYLNFRKQSGEIISAESWLFVRDFDPRDKEQVLHPVRLSYDAIKSRIRQLLIRANVAEYQPLTEMNTTGRRRNTSMASHAFRKTFYTNAARSRMKSEVLELIMGHKIGLRASYLRYSTEDLLAEYLRAVDNLTIDASNRLLAQVDEFKKQEREILELKKQKDEQSAQIQDLRNRMDTMVMVASSVADTSQVRRTRIKKLMTKTDRTREEQEEFDKLMIIEFGYPKKSGVQKLSMGISKVYEEKSNRRELDKLIKGSVKNTMKSKDSTRGRRD